MDTDIITPTDNDQFELPLQEFQALIDEIRDQAAERRARDRYPISCTMRLTPIDLSTWNVLHYETIEVVGKDISVTGIGFSHAQPLLSDRGILSFLHPKIGRFAVEVRIAWTRKTPLGLYESGCRMIKRAAGHTMGAKVAPQK